MGLVYSVFFPPSNEESAGWVFRWRLDMLIVYCGPLVFTSLVFRALANIGKQVVLHGLMIKIYDESRYQIFGFYVAVHCTVMFSRGSMWVFSL